MDKIFDRIESLLPVRTLLRLIVTIFGVGGVGSKIALNLASHAVGAFRLCDKDNVEAENIARGAFYTLDQGKWKTEAVAYKIKLINPQAVVTYENVDVNSIAPQKLASIAQRSNLVIVSCDDPQAQFKINDACYGLVPVLYTAVGPTGAQADIIITIPHVTPCLQDVAKVRRTGGAGSLKGEPGLGVDFDQVALAATKIALWLLLPGQRHALSHLFDPRKSMLLIGNRGKREIFRHSRDDTPIPMVWVYTYHLRPCRICQKRMQRR